jgi:hypothetical protein
VRHRRCIFYPKKSKKNGKRKLVTVISFCQIFSSFFGAEHLLQASFVSRLAPTCWRGGCSNLRFLSGIIATKSGEIASVLFMRGEICAESAFVHGA